MAVFTTTEGMIPFALNGETYHTYYKVVGDLSTRTKPPLVVLHGGPGLSHDYMLPLSDLASTPDPRPVIFYDQIGNARSTHLDDKPESFWTIDFFVQELANLLSYFGVHDSYDLLGHSWGGMLAAEYMIRRQPSGVRHIVLADTLASRQLSQRVIASRMGSLPVDVQKVLEKYKGRVDTSSEEYNTATTQFREQFAVRISPVPEELVKSLSYENHPVVLHAMQGGEIGDGWDITDKLGSVHAQTLVIFGKYDFVADDESCAPFSSMPNSRLVSFSESSHVPHWEERQEYMTVVESFLSE